MPNYITESYKNEKDCAIPPSFSSVLLSVVSIVSEFRILQNLTYNTRREYGTFCPLDRSHCCYRRDPRVLQPVGASDVGTTIDVPQWEGKLLGKEYIKTPGGVTDPAKQVIKE
jgi:hypothetical protein